VPDWLERLRPAERTEPKISDAGHSLVHVTKSGACAACGSGLAAVRVDLT